MKLIITEDRFIKTIKKLFDEEGFDEASNTLGIGKIKLAQILNIPIKGDDFYEQHEAVAYMFLSDLVDMNKEYENCELHYHKRDGSIQWICYWNHNGEELDTLSYSTPYYAGNSTPVQTDYLTSTEGEGSYDARNDDESYGSFDNPDGFNNVDELVEWFESVYLPTTYEMIKNYYDLLLPKYERMKSED
jgi:hypothetical protein